MKLRKNASIETRKLIARDTNTPVDILVHLSRDKEEVVRIGIARNPNTPVDILVLLSQDEDEDVLRRIAENHKTPVDILVRLSQDESGWVRLSIAKNPKWTEPTNQERIKELKELMDLEKELGVELF